MCVLQPSPKPHQTKRTSLGTMSSPGHASLSLSICWKRANSASERASCLLKDASEGASLADVLSRSSS